MRALLLSLVACTVHDPHVHLLDAQVDGAPDAPPDACVYTVDAASDDCCRLLPDVVAVQGCARPAPGSCNETVCRTRDCNFFTIEQCVAPIDAGTNGGDS